MFKYIPAWIDPEGQKVPLFRNWQNLATDDQAQLQKWQHDFRDKMRFWGIPCGPINGIFALDVDVKPGKNGWDTIRKHGFVIPKTLSQKTLSGGSHFIFKFDPNRPLKNRVGFLPGLDIRSTGGWIALYGIDMDWNTPIVDAPEWIYEYAQKYKDNAINTPTGPSIRLAPEIAQGIFHSCLDNIKNAPAGESNDTLNIESFKVGQLVASGAITYDFAFSELFKAAKLRGKPDYEAKATIKSGLDGGMKNPLTSPFPNTAPVAAFPIPEAPKPPERWTPKRLTRSDLLNRAKLRKPQLFQDWSSEDITITTADGGTGKTTLKLFESICLALGDRFLGFDCKQRGKTLFITGEDTAEKLAAMIGKMAEQMGLLDGSPENEEKMRIIEESIFIKKDPDLCLIQKDKQGFLHANGEAMQKLKDAVDDIRPKRIVFDPIASFWGSESALNDMNKAVTKFMSWLTEYAQCEVEMINHMGKSSSANRDMTQFAGRGGSGLPSNSRISRVLVGITKEEFLDKTGKDLTEHESAILCQVNKYSDGSPLLNKPFIIVRNGYLFTRIQLSPQKEQEAERHLTDIEKVMGYIKEQRRQDKFPTRKFIVANFVLSEILPKSRVERVLEVLTYNGHMGEKLKLIENPDQSQKDPAYTIVDEEGKEL